MNRIINALAIGLLVVWAYTCATTMQLMGKAEELKSRVSDLQHQVNTLNQWYAECQRGIEIE
jgi:hypothetical protein